METDWKKYSSTLPMLRERYLARCNARIARMLADPQKNETKRFWDAMEEMEKQAKVLSDCLDPHSRSKMWLHMLLMLRVGMLTKEDLKEFSEELQKELLRDF